MAAIIDTPAADKAALMERHVMMDDRTHRMRIVGVGNTCPEEGTIYLHMASTTKFRKQKNGNVPVQYAGWFCRDHLVFA